MIRPAPEGVPARLAQQCKEKGGGRESSDSKARRAFLGLRMWVFHFGGGLWDRNRKKKKKYNL